MWPDVRFSCAYAGWLGPDVAQCLPLLAPQLAPCEEVRRCAALAAEEGSCAGCGSERRGRPYWVSTPQPSAFGLFRGPRYVQVFHRDTFPVIVAGLPEDGDGVLAGGDRLLELAHLD